MFREVVAYARKASSAGSLLEGGIQELLYGMGWWWVEGDSFLTAYISVNFKKL